MLVRHFTNWIGFWSCCCCCFSKYPHDSLVVHACRIYLLPSRQPSDDDDRAQPPFIDFSLSEPCVCARARVCASIDSRHFREFFQLHDRPGCGRVGGENFCWRFGRWNKSNTFVCVCVSVLRARWINQTRNALTHACCAFLHSRNHQHSCYYYSGHLAQLTELCVFQ